MASSEASTQPSSAEASTQESQTQSQRNVRAKTDIAWGHAIIVLDGGKEKPQCIYCKKIIKGGGINRLKLHLAGETGQVEACGQAPAEVRFKMQQNREETRLKKRKAEGNEVQIGNEEQRQRVQPRSVVVASQKEKGTNSGSFDNYFLTDNAANYVAAGRLLEKEFPGLYWSPCAAHCINLMFQDFGKLPEVQEAVSHATNVTKYIYNHCYPLYLMRKFTHGREILRPAPTRFATNFIALQSILSQKNALRAMVTSQEWTISAYAKDAKAKQFVEQVLNTNFWTACADIVKLTEPLVGVLRLVDSEDKPAMGFLYRNMYKAREEMVKRFQRNKTKVEPYLKIIDDRWDSQLRKNLHAAGYWLNPSCRFSPEFEKHKSTTSGLIDVIEKYARNDHELRAKLNTETSIFRNSEGDFGRKSAIEARNSPFPDEWWELYGCQAPHLQKLAIRVLSQTCSSSGCERNWSVFEHIHSKKRNRLEHQRLNDLVFVRYNLMLENRNKKIRNYDPINDELLDDHHDNWVLEDSPPFLTVEELESLRNDLANMTIQPISNDIDGLNLDEDDDCGNDAPDTNAENMDQSNVLDEAAREDAEFLDELEIQSILTPWN